MPCLEVYVLGTNANCDAKLERGKKTIGPTNSKANFMKCMTGTDEKSNNAPYKKQRMHGTRSKKRNIAGEIIIKHQQ